MCHSNTILLVWGSGYLKKKSETIVVDRLISKYSLLLKVDANHFLCLNYVKNID